MAFGGDTVGVNFIDSAFNRHTSVKKLIEVNEDEAQECGAPDSDEAVTQFKLTVTTKRVHQRHTL